MPTTLTRLTAFGGTNLLHSQVRQFRFAPHWHDEYVIAAYHGGQKNLRCGISDTITQKGDLLIIAPGTIHSATVHGAKGWHYRALYLSEAQICDALKLTPEALRQRTGDHIHLRNVPSLPAELPAALDAGSISELAITEWLLATLGQLPTHRPATKAPPQSLRLIRECILDDPAHVLRMSDLTALTHVTPEHLSRSFRAQFGLSPFQMLTAARLDLARRAIANGSSLCQAAMQAGFSDQSHMTRWFRRAYGVTPGQLPRH